jgi:hypothetical protein
MEKSVDRHISLVQEMAPPVEGQRVPWVAPQLTCIDVSDRTMGVAGPNFDPNFSEQS